MVIYKTGLVSLLQQLKLPKGLLPFWYNIVMVLLKLIIHHVFNAERRVDIL